VAAATPLPLEAHVLARQAGDLFLCGRPDQLEKSLDLLAAVDGDDPAPLLGVWSAVVEAEFKQGPFEGSHTHSVSRRQAQLPPRALGLAAVLHLDANEPTLFIGGSEELDRLLFGAVHGWVRDGPIISASNCARSFNCRPMSDGIEQLAF
jgi:hypothetical protein